MLFYRLNKGPVVQPVSAPHKPTGPMETRVTPPETEKDKKSVLPAAPDASTEVPAGDGGETDAEEKAPDAEENISVQEAPSLIQPAEEQIQEKETRPAKSVVSSTEGLIACFSFDGDAGDISGHENHAKVYSAELTEDRFGYQQRAFLFDGKRSYLKVYSKTRSVFSNGLTFTTWIFPMKSKKGMILGQWSSGRQSKESKYLLFDSGQNITFQVFPGMQYPLKSNSPIDLDHWTHIAATYDGTASKLFINGKMSAGLPAGQTWGNARGTWYIGCSQAAGNSGLKKQDHFAGIIDDLRIYNRALSESELNEIYSHEKPEPTSIEIHMKSGKVITLEKFWEDEDQIKYELYGGIITIYKENIAKIIRK